MRELIHAQEHPRPAGGGPAEDRLAGSQGLLRRALGEPSDQAIALERPLQARWDPAGPDGCHHLGAIEACEGEAAREQLPRE
jgi:hypothetical protein